MEEYEASVLLLRAAHDPDVQNRLLQRAAIDALAWSPRSTTTAAWTGSRSAASG